MVSYGVARVWELCRLATGVLGGSCGRGSVGWILPGQAWTAGWFREPTPSDGMSITAYRKSGDRWAVGCTEDTAGWHPKEPQAIPHIWR